jgi:hypothetical protein
MCARVFACVREGLRVCVRLDPVVVWRDPVRIDLNRISPTANSDPLTAS